ncbi:nucleotidyltransferase domain-containing protein [Corallococcus terminator]|uniref:Cyclic GMP-AMP synthase n=1 Tax=Corallococcus terminator TaxID=2316733 RepID=A0A3A8J0X4_9BACT|nr:nucleotidyltransferase [Corallococcus terminator]RKG89312.1 nucleotidyltransferase [Corallococcus terminator]
MANVQNQLIEFDKKIRLGWNTEGKTLREKRDIILEKLRTGFAEMRKEGKEVPSFSDFNQGSYQMDTGIWPADGDYDIDVGLRFNCSKGDYENPADLKILVADVLEGHTVLGTKVKKSCVTVIYRLDGEQAYHVDLAVYAYEDPDSSQKRLFLAKGQRGSDEDNRWWEESDPQGLTTWVENRFKDEQRAQFLRVIRALKRWKTEKFKTDGSNAPSGIGLTVAAGMWFQPEVHVDAYAGRTNVDDLRAMRTFVKKMVEQFQWIGVNEEDNSPLYRLTVQVPVAPGLDIFERMSDGQMTTFRDRLVQLRDRLEEVTNEPDTVRACQLMRQHFGEEFPVPDKKDTGSGGGRAIVSSGISA